MSLVLAPREVPLGGLRALTVRRTLPHRDRSFVGAWCFVDHYGPTTVTAGAGMDVAPHPHTSLQTVSWLFSGAVEHRDSTGAHAVVRPGELNLMTAGRGVSHSEVSLPDTTELHGVQLWVVLPEAAAELPPRFEHYVPPVARLSAAALRVFVGSLAGQDSPVMTATELLGAEVVIDAHGDVSLPVRPDFEHGVLLDTAELIVDGHELARGDLIVLDAGRDAITLSNAGPTPARAMLIGGLPFTEDVVMWWNFIGRSHDEIVELRDEWQRRGERFGQVSGYYGRMPWIPAPPLPGGRLVPRRRLPPADLT